MNNDVREDVMLSRLRLRIPHVPPRLVLLVVGFCLVILGVAVFQDFLLGDKVLLYKDVGSDSINDSYPYFVHLSDYLRTVGLPSWSFYVGMGQSLFYRTGDLLWEPIVWLPRKLIPQALVFQHLLKILIAGLLFFRFLQLRGLSYLPSFLGSLLLSFSAYMCLGSCWYICADDTVCFTFLLFAVEKALSHGRWIYVTLAVALIGLVTVFHFYLAAILLCCYVPFRLIERHGWQPASQGRVCLQLGAVAFLGVGLASVVCFGAAFLMLNTPRGSGTANLNWDLTPSLFHVESFRYYLTAALRPFSTDMLGTGDQFRGWENYFEAPQSYCGLISLLLLPQIFIGAARTQRILYVLFFGLVAGPVLLPWFRYLFWLFESGAFRTFSLFSVFGVVTLSMTAFSRYLEGRKLSLWILGATLVVLLAVLYLPNNQLETVINPAIRRTAVMFLVLDSILLLSGQVLKRQNVAGWLIVILTVVELIYFDRITVSDRPTVTKTELKERIGYNDETVDVVGDLKADDQSFFRMTKTWSSGPSTRESLNDSMVFGYHGTSSYSSFNSLDYINFLRAVDAFPKSDVAIRAQWSMGLLGQPLLSTFACERYILTDKPVPFQVAEHYESVKRYGDVYLFRNKACLPLGLVFNRYVLEDIFLQLPDWAKPHALLHAAVLSQKHAANNPELSQLSLDELTTRMRDISLVDVLAERRATAFDLSAFQQTRISGMVRSHQKGILVLQTPFDAGWHASIDGRTVPVLKVDAGLLGISLPESAEAIELRYRPPFLYAGAAVTLVCALILLLSVWRWPRIHLPG